MCAVTIAVLLLLFLSSSIQFHLTKSSSYLVGGLPWTMLSTVHSVLDDTDVASECTLPEDYQGNTGAWP